MSNDKQWLTLKEAAGRLDVHPATLRRWADDGQIPVMLTPGRHRRFATAEVTRFAAERHGRRRTGDLEQIWAEQALTHTRQEIVNRQNAGWLAGLDADLRQQHRLLGRQLMGLTLQYISAVDDNQSLLDEAAGVGQQYGRLAQNLGLPLTEALKTAMFFRDTMVEVALQLPETARVQPEANVRLMRRINQLLNTVHLSIAAVYDAIPTDDEDSAAGS